MATRGRTLGALLWLLSGCGVQAKAPAAGDSAAPAAAARGVEDSIRTLEQVWADAVRTRDSLTLERLMAPDFVLANAADTTSPPLPRAPWIANTMQRLRVDSVRLTPAQVAVRGDTATAALRFVWAGRFMQQPAFYDSTDLTDVWVRDAEGWRVHRRTLAR